MFLNGITLWLDVSWNWCWSSFCGSWFNSYIIVVMLETQVPSLGGGRILDSGGGWSRSTKSKMLRSPAFCLVATCSQPSLWKNALLSACNSWTFLSVDAGVTWSALPTCRQGAFERTPHSPREISNPQVEQRWRDEGGAANLTSTSYWGPSREAIILGCLRKMQRNWWLLVPPVACNATPSVPKHDDRRLPAEKRPLRMAVSATTPGFFHIPFHDRWKQGGENTPAESLAAPPSFFEHL